MSLLFFRSIPKRRLLSAAIALIFASTIFVGVNLLFVSLNNVSQDFFGTSDDVLVFYNQKGTTPFTSQISQTYTSAFEVQPEVKTISPELFQPVVIGKTSSFLRGVNFSAVLNLDEGKLIKGRVPLDRELFSTIIGNSLANRLDVGVSETISVKSTLTNQIIDLTITGIYQTKQITNDELLTSMFVARTISGFDSDSLTHIRVKYDPTRITKNQLLDKAITEYEYFFNIKLGNATDVSDFQLTVKDKFGNLITTKKKPVSFKQKLLSGKYRVQYKLADTQHSKELVVTNSGVVNISLGDNRYLTTFEIQSPHSLNNLQFQILRNNSTINQGSTNTKLIETYLQKGKYSIILKKGLTEKKFDFSINGTETIDLHFYQIRLAIFEQKINNSVFLEQKLSFNIANSSTNAQYYLNDTRIHSTTSSLLQSSQLEFDLSNGNYNLTVRDGQDEIYQQFVFTVDNNLNLIETNISDYHHYKTGSKIKVRIPYSFDLDYGSSLSLVSKNNNIYHLKMQDDPGFYRIRFRLNDTLGNSYIQSIDIAVENNPDPAGFISSTNTPTFRINETLELWNTSSILSFSGDGDLNITKNGIKLVAVDNPGDKISNLSTSIGNVSLNYKITSSYLELFDIRNSTGIFDLPTTITSNFTLIYPSTKVSGLQNWDVQINLGNGFFDVYHNQTVFIPKSDSGNLEIWITNLIANKTETSNITLTKLSNIQTFNLISGTPNYSAEGIISLRTTTDTNLSFTSHNRNNYTPISLGSDQYQLKTGMNILVVSNNIVTFNWTVFVPKWGNIHDNITKVSHNKMYLNNPIVFASPGKYSTENTIFVKRGIILPETDLSRETHQKSVRLSLSRIIAANVTISYSNGTKLSYPLTSHYLNFDDFSNVNLTIVVDYMQINGRTGNISRFIRLDNQFQNNTIRIEYDDQVYEKLSAKFTYLQSNRVLQFNISSYPAILEINGSTIEPVRIVIVNDVNNVTLYQNVFSLQNNITIYPGLYSVDLNFFNPNFGWYENSTTISIAGENQISTINYNGQSILLGAGSYSIEFQTSSMQGASFLNIPEKTNYNLTFDIKTINLQVELVDFPPKITSSITVSHLILNTTIMDTLQGDIHSYNIEFPVGPLEISIQGEWGMKKLQHTLKSSNSSVVITITKNNQESPTVDYSKLGNQHINVASGENYLDQFLGGALKLVEVILITEIILISLLLILNYSEIFAHVMVESKNEIRAMKSIGFSRHGIILTICSSLLLFSPLIAFLGYLLGALLLQVIFKLDATVFFGHQFKPAFFDWSVFLINLLISPILLYFSAYIAYFRES